MAGKPKLLGHAILSFQVDLSMARQQVCKAHRLKVPEPTQRSSEVLHDLSEAAWNKVYR